MVKIKLKKGEIIPLTFDYMFTEIFNNEENICILEEFISFYLDIPLSEVRGNLKLLSRKLKKENKIDSKKEVDLLLRLRGEKINIELNNRFNKDIMDRNVVYIGKVHGTQLKRGFKTYKRIKRTIQINLDNSKYGKELIEKYYLQNEEGKVLTEKLRIDIINLEKGNKMSYTSDERKNNLIRWCKVFKSETVDELSNTLKEIMSNKSRTKLLEEVNKLSGDDEMVELYTDLSRREIEYNTLLEDALEKREIEYNTLLEDALEQQEKINMQRLEEALEHQDKIHEKRLEEALEEQDKIHEKRLEEVLEQQEEKSKKEEKLIIAKNLIKLNIPIESIISATGLTKEEIESL